jgi:hypothetical protein
LFYESESFTATLQTPTISFLQPLLCFIPLKKKYQQLIDRDAAATATLSECGTVHPPSSLSALLAVATLAP